MALNIYVNTAADSLASARSTSLTNNTERPFAKFIAGDVVDVNIYLTDGAGAYVDVSSTTLRVGVGGINQRPSGGYWTFSHGGNDTEPAYNESAASLESTLDAAPYSFDVTVASPTTSVWIVKFNTVGAQTLPTVAGGGYPTGGPLTPDSTASITRLVTGDGSTREEWLIQLFETPWAFQDSWSNITNGKNGSLSFAQENLYTALAASDSVSAYFEIEATLSSNITTYIQAPVTVGCPVGGKA